MIYGTGKNHNVNKKIPTGDPGSSPGGGAKTKKRLNMNMKVFSFTERELSQYLNAGKNMTLRQLVSDGIITEELSEKLSKEYHIIYADKNLFNRLWDKLFEDSNEALIMTKVCDNSTIIDVKER